MAGGRFWTTQEHRQAIEWMEEGVAWKVISKRLGRSLSAINNRLSAEKRKRAKENGTLLPRLHKPGELAGWVRKLCIPGVPDSCVAAILGVNRITVMRCRQRLGIEPGCRQHAKIRRPGPWMKDAHMTRAGVIRLYAVFGQTIHNMARVLGVAVPSISHHLGSLGLPRISEAGRRSKVREPEPDAVQGSRVVLEAAVLVLYRSGQVKSDARLARELGISESYVTKIRRRLKLAPLGKSLSERDTCKSATQ